MEDIPNKQCLSDDTAYKHTSFDTIDRSILPPGTQPVPVLKKPITNHVPEYNCNKFVTNGLDSYYTEILNCSKDNRSRTCPGLICNNNKEMTENNNIYNRNVPNSAQYIELDMRPSGRTCYKYRSFAGPRELTYNKGTQPVERLVAGKGDYYGYAQNVGLESDLFNINRKTQNTPCHRYVSECSDCVKPCSVDAPFCAANGKAPELKNNQNALVDDTKPEHLEYVNTMNSQQIKEKCSYGENDLNCDNFMALTGKCTMRAECGNTNESLYYSHQGLDKQYYIREAPTPLVVGPIRNDQKCESAWNNITRRRMGTKLTNLKKF